jgi:hypothetical protein
MTPMMGADDLAQAFNAATERKYWKAILGGSRGMPTVIFKSRSSMVELTYYTQSNVFAVTYSKATCAFGDFMQSAYAALGTVLTALKATGHPVSAPLGEGEGVLRVEYDAKLKTAYVTLAKLGDDWQDVAPAPAKIAPVL